MKAKKKKRKHAGRAERKQKHASRQSRVTRKAGNRASDARPRSGLDNGHKGSPVVVTVTIGTAEELPQLTVAKHLAAEQLEHAYLREVMTRAGGSLSAAGRMAGYDRRNLRRRLEAHGIDPQSFIKDQA